MVEGHMRRRLPAERAAITHHFCIGGYDMYLTIGLYPEGDPGEIFLKAAKEGSSLSGMLDSFAIAFSLGLQYGVPLAALVDKFSFTRFEPSGYTGHAKIPYATSPVDYVARWIALKFLSDEEKPQPNAPAVSIPPSPASVTGDGPPCSHCGHLLQRSGSCWVCPNCASTSGCG